MNPDELKQLLLKIIALQQQIAGQQHELFVLMQRVKINESLAFYLDKITPEKGDPMEMQRLSNSIQRKNGIRPSWQAEPVPPIEIKQHEPLTPENNIALQELTEKIAQEKREREERRAREKEGKRKLAMIEREKRLEGMCHRCTICISGDYAENASKKYSNLCHNCEIRTDEEKGIEKLEKKVKNDEGYYYKSPNQI